MAESDSFYVYGRKPVEEALIEKPKNISKVFIKNSIPPNSYKNISEITLKNRVPVSVVPDQKLNRLVGRVNHQGFVASLSTIEFIAFYDWLDDCDLSKNPAVLLLDGIEDPHNLGAILRTAAAAGIEAVVIPSQNQAPVNATVFKTSAGTAGRIPIIRVHDSNQGVKDLKNAGFSIFALHASADQTIWEVDMERPIAFLIGNEGRGVNKQLLKKSDQLVKLPMEHNVESLNASVTAALVSYEWKRKRLIIK